MSDGEMFKTTLMGGYDKDDVTYQFNKLRDAQEEARNQLKKDMAGKDGIIADLTKIIEEKNKEKEKLEKDITDKYQKYVDHYDSISGLLVDAQIRADEIIGNAQIRADEILSDAKKTKEHMIEMTEMEIKRKFESVQAEVDEKIADGERKHDELQAEMYKILDLINQAQKHFMASYKEIHNIVNDIPKHTTESDDEGEN